MNQAEIADLAFASTSAAEFRRSALAFLADNVPFDLAAFHDESDAACHGYSETGAGQALRSSARYMGELTPEEIRALAGRRPAVDIELMSRARRERLAMYREVYSPHGVSAMMVALGRHAHGAFGLHVARTGHGRGFRHAEVERFASYLPALRLADAYVVARDHAHHPERTFDAWADGIHLTRTERSIVRLVIRGLQNREIALLLQSSWLTVRNHLGQVFRKAGVTNRAELAYICTTRASSPAPAPWVHHLDGR